MKGEINKTQITHVFQNSLGWRLLIWVSRLLVTSSLHLVKLSGSHTHVAPVREAVKPKEEKQHVCQKLWFPINNEVT